MLTKPETSEKIIEFQHIEQWTVFFPKTQGRYILKPTKERLSSQVKVSFLYSLPVAEAGEHDQANSRRFRGEFERPLRNGARFPRRNLRQNDRRRRGFIHKYFTSSLKSL